MARGRKRKVAAVLVEPLDDTPVDHLGTFTKLPKLSPELRQHLLSYSGLAALFHYAQCAKFCQADVQEFSKIVPWYVKVSDYVSFGQNGLEVCLHFKHKKTIVRFTDVGNGNYIRYEKDRLFVGDWDMDVLDGDPIEAGYNFLKKALRFVKYGRCLEFMIDLDNWNDQVFTHRAIPYVNKFVITIGDSNYQGFIDNMNQLDRINSTFIIVHKDRVEDIGFEMPPSYYTSKFLEQHGSQVMTFPPTNYEPAGFPLHSKFYSAIIPERKIINAIKAWLYKSNTKIDFEIHVPVTHEFRYDVMNILSELPKWVAESQDSFKKHGKLATLVVEEKFVMCRQVW